MVFAGNRRTCFLRLQQRTRSTKIPRMGAGIRSIKNEETSMKEIWKTLSAIDCSKHIEKKNGLSYLSWAWAWGVLMEHYPEATFEFEPPQSQPDGTMTVFCTITIGEASRRMWLPVMDYKNKAIVNPDAFAINTAMMRCLVKCMALFGLGLYIYAGEDLPLFVEPEKKVLPTDAGITFKIHSSQSIDDLRDIWKGLSAEQREAHAEIFAEVKERLE